MKSSFRRGFTLIELLVAMIILSILATMIIGTFRSSQAKSRDSRRKGELKNIAAALEFYYNDKGGYPADDGSGKIKACAPDDATVCNWGSIFQDKNSTIYMVKLPTDPASGYTYYYDALGANNTSYQLYARLENTLDPDVPKSGTIPQNYGISCGAKNCNYGIASTNTTADAGRVLINE